MRRGYYPHPNGDTYIDGETNAYGTTTADIQASSYSRTPPLAPRISPHALVVAMATSIAFIYHGDVSPHNGNNGAHAFGQTCSHGTRMRQ